MNFSKFSIASNFKGKNYFCIFFFYFPRFLNRKLFAIIIFFKFFFRTILFSYESKIVIRILEFSFSRFLQYSFQDYLKYCEKYFQAIFYRYFIHKCLSIHDQIDSPPIIFSRARRVPCKLQ